MKKEKVITLYCEEQLNRVQAQYLGRLKHLFQNEWSPAYKLRKTAHMKKYETHEEGYIELYKKAASDFKNLTSDNFWRFAVKQEVNPFGKPDQVISEIFTLEADLLKQEVLSNPDDWKRIRDNYLFMRAFAYSPIHKNIFYQTRIAEIVNNFNSFGPWKKLNNNNQTGIKKARRAKDPSYETKCLVSQKKRASKYRITQIAADKELYLEKRRLSVKKCRDRKNLEKLNLSKISIQMESVI